MTMISTLANKSSKRSRVTTSVRQTETARKSWRIRFSEIFRFWAQRGTTIK